MNERMSQLKNTFLEEIQKISSLHDLEQLKIKYLGKKGPIQELARSLKDLTPEERPEAGKWINLVKTEIEDTLTSAFSRLVAEEEQRTLLDRSLDISLPGRRTWLGGKHVITLMMDRMLDILISMGFSVQCGPDIDTDYYNFEALNFAPDHPARDMQDTFYLDKNTLLRTHTSNVQARVMESHSPPIRIIAPGKVYRNESITVRSHVFFHQIEAMYIDKDVSFAMLQSTLTEFFSRLLQKEVKIRFRPSYFPFVEPGMEVDIECEKCKGSGCNLCKHSGWLEVAGAGMIHPEVLKNGNIDPELFSGFAWGIGVERLTMLYYGISDIRLFVENDLRFLRQFSPS